MARIAFFKRIVDSKATDTSEARTGKKSASLRSLRAVMTMRKT